MNRFRIWLQWRSKDDVSKLLEVSRHYLDDIVFIVGLALLGYGLSELHVGYAPIAIGFLLVLHANPLITWFK